MKSDYNFIIIEDVPLQRENLIGMLSGRMDLCLVDSFETAEAAYQFLNNKENDPVDLIFLDIELPERNGLDFLSSIKNFSHKPRIIITTAYPKYAIPSFDYTDMVSHYVLKPIDGEKLNKAVDKAILDLQNEQIQSNIITNEITREPATRPFGYFSVADREIKLYFDELLYCEGANVNVKLVTVNHVYTTRGPLKSMALRLPEQLFRRVHDSFIINLSFVRAYTKRFDSLDIRHDDQEEGQVIPIGKKYRNEIKDLLSSGAFQSTFNPSV